METKPQLVGNPVLSMTRAQLETLVRVLSDIRLPEIPTPLIQEFHGGYLALRNRLDEYDKKPGIIEGLAAMAAVAMLLEVMLEILDLSMETKPQLVGNPVLSMTQAQLEKLVRVLSDIRLSIPWRLPRNSGSIRPPTR